MRRTRLRAAATLTIGGTFVALAVILLGTPSVAEARTPDQILADIDAVVIPKLDPDKRGDTLAMIEYLGKRKAAMERRGTLIRELFATAPDHPKLPSLFVERWQDQLRTSDGDRPIAGLLAELEEVMAQSKNGKLKADAAFYRTILEVQTGDGDAETVLKTVEKFIKLAPKDERGAMLLVRIAGELNGSPRQFELYRRIVADYPGTPYAESASRALRKQESVGKPFELSFKDAIKGTPVAMKDLRGKVVVIDFWATWCGPCVAEMPRLKELYAKYRDQGVEFLGVNLDAPEKEGGLDQLKEFVSRNEISWPQYYQGKGWESEFSSSWGIDAIPAMFVVDQDGKLVDVDARGRLEEIIPELLKKGQGPKPGE